MSSRITLFIPSKDRATQLDGLLKSISENAQNLFSVNIQFTTSDDQYLAGYSKLIDEYAPSYGFPQVWNYETDLVPDFVQAVRKSTTSLFGIMCDDCIYYRKQDAMVEDIEDLLDTHTLAFSLRLGLNCIIQDYRTGQVAHIPPVKYVNSNGHKTKFIRWDYTAGNIHSNFYYPFGQDGHIFRTSQWLDILENTQFHNLRELESKLCLGRHKYHSKPLMASYEYSSVFSNPINQSQGGLYHSDKHHIPLDELNRKFLDGYRIDLSKMDFSDIRGCHQEVEVKLC